MNIESKLKCASGLPRYFVKTFDRILYMFGMPIVVGSSFMLILLTCLCLRLHQLVPRGSLVYLSVLSAPLTSPWTFEALLSCLRIFLTIASTSLRMRKGNRAHQVNVVGYQLHGKEGKRVYMLPLNPSIHNNPLLAWCFGVTRANLDLFLNA